MFFASCWNSPEKHFKDSCSRWVLSYLHVDISSWLFRWSSQLKHWSSWSTEYQPAFARQSFSDPMPDLSNKHVGNTVPNRNNRQQHRPIFQCCGWIDIGGPDGQTIGKAIRSQKSKRKEKMHPKKHHWIVWRNTTSAGKCHGTPSRENLDCEEGIEKTFSKRLTSL